MDGVLDLKRPFDPVDGDDVRQEVEMRSGVERRTIVAHRRWGGQ